MTKTKASDHLAAALAAAKAGNSAKARQLIGKARALPDGKTPEAEAIIAHIGLLNGFDHVAFASLCQALRHAPEHAGLNALFWRHASHDEVVCAPTLHQAMLASLRANPAQKLTPPHLQALRKLQPPFAIGTVGSARKGKIAGWIAGGDSLDVEIDGGFTRFALDETQDGSPLRTFSIKLPKEAACARFGAAGTELAGSPHFASHWTPQLAIGEETRGESSTVNILVPAYRQAEQIAACLDSVLASRNKTPFKIWVVNDASPEPEVHRLLQERMRACQILLIERPINAGFLGAVNTGLRFIPEGDVVLLNSDVRVHGDWLDRLRAAAMRPDVGTVTPMTNNGELLSHPLPMRANPDPTDAELATLDKLFKRLGPNEPLDIPTGVGFCLYIRRAAINRVGGLDEKLIYRGYGDDTDYCLRVAAAGLRNVAACNVYVAHAGSGSFGVDKKALVRKNVIDQLHLIEDHRAEYRAFLTKDPCGELRRQVQRKMLQSHALPPDLVVRAPEAMENFRSFKPGLVPVIEDGKAEPGLIRLVIDDVAGLGAIDYRWPRQSRQLVQDLRQCGVARISSIGQSPWMSNFINELFKFGFRINR